MIKINFYSIRKWVYFYIALPTFIFLGLYIDSLLGILFLIFAIIAFSNLVHDNRKKQLEEKACVVVPIKWIILLACVAIFWSYLGGQGNLFYQNSDWGVRNAIYRDLIYRAWPVKYPDYNKALVYYISYWLPPASVVKIIGKLFPVIMETETAFVIGNMFLWIWTSIGICLTGMLFITYTKPKDTKKFLWIPFVLVFFSGLDIVGAMYKIITKGMIFGGMHIEWWAEIFQFSSLTTCLFWVFNQAIIPWIAILCLIQENEVRDYVFLGCCAFASGPIPFLGVFVYMIPNAINRMIKQVQNKQVKSFAKEIFSLSNCASLIVIAIYISYYMSNMALSTGIENSETITIGFLKLVPIKRSEWGTLISFLFLEVGIYFVFLFKEYRHNIFYWLSIVTSLIAPFFKIGTSTDFVMRFSIPTIMVTATLCLDFLINGDSKLNEHRKIWYNRVCYTGIIVCLAIGSITALSEIARGYNVMMNTGVVAATNDWLKTLDQDRDKTDLNFVVYDYKETFFFKYIAPKD